MGVSGQVYPRRCGAVSTAAFCRVAFGRAVNVTLGLPIVRTSVDHGAGLDIAGKGAADPSAMIAAVRLAARLAAVRPAASASG